MHIGKADKSIVCVSFQHLMLCATTLLKLGKAREIPYGSDYLATARVHTPSV